MLKKYQLKHYSFPLVMLLIAICAIGVMVVGSAEPSLQKKQFFGVCLGLVVMVVVSLIDYYFLLRFSWVYYILSLVLLLSVKFFGVEVNGSKRWIDLKVIQFQPSELCKILLILFFAQYFMKHRNDINKFKTIVQTIVLMAIPLLFIFKQPDLSTTIVTAMILATLFFISGLSYKVILPILLIAIPSVFIFLGLVVQPDQQIFTGDHEYQRMRIMAWLEPDEYAQTYAYQQLNAVTAIGSGQLHGKGLNNTEVVSVKNGSFISEAQTDFIFSIIGEELGFVGAAGVVILLMGISIKCILIGRNAKDFAGRVICTGMGGLIGYQSFINMGVSTMLLPNTGLPLPFVSYGLTSVVSLFIGMGLVLNVGLQQKKFERGMYTSWLLD